MAKAAAKPVEKTTGLNIRDRIVEFKRIPVAELLDHAGNPNRHPAAQKNAMAGVLQDVGVCAALVVYVSQRSGGRYVVIDGHMRKNDFPLDGGWPCVVTDLNDEEADLLLAAHDSVGAMAIPDQDKLDALVREFHAKDWLRTIFGGEAEVTEVTRDAEAQLAQLDTRPPPKMTWVLVGIPTVRFGEIAPSIEQIAAMPDVLCESTSNDG